MTRAMAGRTGRVATIDLSKVPFWAESKHCGYALGIKLCTHLVQWWDWVHKIGVPAEAAPTRTVTEAPNKKCLRQARATSRVDAQQAASLDHHPQICCTISHHALFSHLPRLQYNLFCTQECKLSSGLPDTALSQATAPLCHRPLDTSHALRTFRRYTPKASSGHSHHRILLA